MLDTYKQAEIDEAFDVFKIELQLFLDAPCRNMHVYGNNIISVYTRKGHHFVEGSIRECLDIASISIADEYQRLGLGMKVIDYMHNINPMSYTFIESLLNEQLHERLFRQHWLPVPNSTPPSVYKVKSKG